MDIYTATELAYKNGYEAATKEIKEKLKFYLDTNEENGVVYIPKFFVEKIVYGR